MFAGDVLVGNFGNGRISAYQDRGGGSGCTRASCASATETLVTLEGLWAIAFGNGAAAGPTSTLYFLAGPGDEKHGMLGAITAAG